MSKIDDIYKELYELCDDQIDNNTIDSISVHLMDEYAEEKPIRVYSNKGHCFDMAKHPIYDENENITGYEYVVDQVWDGFEKIDEESFLMMLKSIN